VVTHKEADDMLTAKHRTLDASIVQLYFEPIQVLRGKSQQWYWLEFNEYLIGCSESKKMPRIFFVSMPIPTRKHQLSTAEKVLIILCGGVGAGMSIWLHSSEHMMFHFGSILLNHGV
jgi:hypothetical protein